MQPDPRHPDRWRRVIQCRTADRGSSQKTFKEVILQRCDELNDDWAHTVRLRVQAAVSDLHAADAQYHKDCLAKFKSNFGPSQTNVDSNDDAFQQVVDCMLRDTTHIWNSVEIEDLYKSHEGKVLSRRLLIQNLKEKLEPNLLILSGDGVASILIFRNQASKHMRLVDNEEDDIETALGRVAKTITKEAVHLKRDQSTYETRICLDDVLADSSPTLLSLLSRLSPKFESTLPTAMIGNMVTSAVTNKPTFLQIVLGIAVRDKSIIELLYDHGVSSSYDEILRFKGSAAHAAAKKKEHLGNLLW